MCEVSVSVTDQDETYKNKSISLFPKKASTNSVISDIYKDKRGCAIVTTTEELLQQWD